MIMKAYKLVAYEENLNLENEGIISCLSIFLIGL